MVLRVSLVSRLSKQREKGPPDGNATESNSTMSWPARHMSLTGEMGSLVGWTRCATRTPLEGMVVPAAATLLEVRAVDALATERTSSSAVGRPLPSGPGSASPLASSSAVGSALGMAGGAPGSTKTEISRLARTWKRTTVCGAGESTRDLRSMRAGIMALCQTSSARSLGVIRSCALMAFCSLVAVSDEMKKGDLPMSVRINSKYRLLSSRYSLTAS
mmetsp:Transcript_52608/g.129072  ORF Transcript_52608/g.129072 Transcript_52608/m.129072 type:complete len:217 (-) Transcript_52608:567-1217(-)